MAKKRKAKKKMAKSKKRAAPARRKKVAARKPARKAKAKAKAKPKPSRSAASARKDQAAAALRRPDRAASDDAARSRGHADRGAAVAVPVIGAGRFPDGLAGRERVAFRHSGARAKRVSPESIAPAFPY